MKRILSFLIMCLFAINTWAQMSEEQIVEYVKTQNEAGVSQQQIAQNLLKRGVTRQQLENLRTKYMNRQGAAATESNGSSADDRSRKNNGEDISLNFGMNNDFESLVQEKKKIFGHDIFRSKELSFEPNMNIATPATYVLGPGDEVILDIYGVSQTSSKMKITPEGAVVVPKVGPIYVSGMTADQAQAKIRQVMGGHYQNSTIKLSVGQTRTVTINVMGEVKTPGTYSLSAFSTVFNALYMAGGITDIGTLRNIKVVRNGRIFSTIDVYDYIINGKLTGNVMLHDNDAIIVSPYENLVEITGCVKRPMIYELKKNESLKSALSFAGGFTGWAYKEKVRVDRKGQEGLTVHNVDEWDFSSFTLEDEDVITVDSIIERYKDMIEIAGAVFRPGKYKLNNQSNTIKGLIKQAGGLTEQAFTNRAVVQRLKEDRTRKILTVDLKGILDGTTPDVMLQNEDSVVIATLENETKERHVLIDGPVFFPGKYLYADNESVEDLIVRAGGLKENASLVNVEVSRRYLDKEGNEDYNQLSKVYHVTLQNGLPINGDESFTLQPYDVVSIFTSPDYHGQQGVSINGEVVHAGLYVITNKTERISDIVKRAGGVTLKASLKNARLIRYLNDQERAIQEELLEMHLNDSIVTPKYKIKDRYNVGIDLEKALEKPGSDYDIVLRGGDEITIPQISSTVRINGSVLHPNSVAYIKGKKASYYINEAGGIKKDGDKSRAYIMYANGHVSKLSKGKVESGCEIIIPEKIDKRGVDPAKVSQWVAITSGIATLAALIVSLIK